MNFDLNALRAIVVGDKLGSFAQAARHLCRSQSAISMQLKKLEEQVGVPLFVRSGNRLVPTEAGQKLLTYARQIVALNDEAASTIAADLNISTVRLGMPQDFANQILPIILKAFAKDYPNVHIEAHIGRNYALAEEVKLGQLDVALIFTTDNDCDPDDLIAEMDMIWAGPPDQIILKENEPVPLVAFNFPCEFRKQGIDALERVNRPWRYTLTTPSLAGVWAAISAGLGITVRTRYQTPERFLKLNKSMNLPCLPKMYVTRVEHSTLTPAGLALSNIVKAVAIKQLKGS